MAAEELAIRIRAAGAQRAAGEVSRLRTSIAGIGEEAESAGDRTDRGMGRAKLAIAALGTAIAGLGVKGLSDALDIEQATSKMSAQLGVTAEQGARFGKIAGDLYANAYGDSISDVNDTIVALRQNLGSMGDSELKSATTAVLNLQSAWDESGSAISRAMGSLKNNDMVGSSQEAADIITQGFVRGANSGGEFLDTLNEYAVQFKGLGFDAKEFTEILVAGSGAGAYSVDKVADAVKEFGLLVRDSSSTAADGFKAIGLNADDMASRFSKGGSSAQGALKETAKRLMDIDDEAARIKATTQLFGTPFEDAGGPQVKAFLSSLMDAEGALGRTKGAVDRFDKTLGGTSKTSLSAFSRQLQMGLAGVAEQYVLPALKDVVAMVQTAGGPLAFVGSLLAATGVDGRMLATVLIALAGTYGAVRVATAAYSAVAGPLGRAIGWLRTQHIGLRIQLALLRAQMIATATAGLAWRGVLLVAAGAARVYAAAQWLMNAAMRANPVVKVITLLVLLGVGLVALWKKSETFRRIVTGVWNALKSAATWAGNAAIAVKDGFGAALDWVISKVEWLIDKLGKVIEVGKTALDIATPGGKHGLLSDDGLLGLPGVPGLATGGSVLSGGLTWVGERGPELLSLPAGAQVLNHRDSMRAASVAPGSVGGVPGAARAAGPPAQGGGGGDVYVYIDSDEIATRVERRMRRQKNITGRPAFR